MCLLRRQSWSNSNQSRRQNDKAPSACTSKLATFLPHLDLEFFFLNLVNKPLDKAFHVYIRGSRLRSEIVVLGARRPRCGCSLTDTGSEKEEDRNFLHVVQTTQGSSDEQPVAMNRKVSCPVNTCTSTQNVREGPPTTETLTGLAFSTGEHLLYTNQEHEGQREKRLL